MNGMNGMRKMNNTEIRFLTTEMGERKTLSAGLALFMRRWHKEA
jgi:hypothetical protein